MTGFFLLFLGLPPPNQDGEKERHSVVEIDIELIVSIGWFESFIEQKVVAQNCDRCPYQSNTGIIRQRISFYFF